MTLWNRPYTTAELDELQGSSAAGQLGMSFTAIGPDWVEAKLPLHAKTIDEHGNMHGGALSILAETIGSTAATMAIDTSVNRVVGQTLNVYHTHRSSAGPMIARCHNVSINERTHVWRIDIHDADHRLVSFALLTMAVIEAAVALARMTCWDSGRTGALSPAAGQDTASLPRRNACTPKDR
ncbi:PaaI family thioesterase [Steroidobacter sp. S1-65]|uniref:PaaI family thioesterase n=1 Tax=Steroidobacter gossypii TaxID=2805490 RepID=A0ABS1WYK8_9GAMM|nr:PaaI family thioesterase [Steroidobacter gossypii]MBM0106055.1 PaaI family thioesterase [Steroidobacter gossypii]